MSQLSKDFASKIEEIFLKKKLPKKIAVAVSGGADSLALTLLLQEFFADKKTEIFALTVNHKMRKDSAKEARALGKILAKKKIAHQILEIPAQKIPTKNIEANLRELRYELLGDFCKKNKIEFLFLGHHLGDVAENFLIRLFRGSGLDGLSPIGEVVSGKWLVVSGVRVVRPLLDVTKDDLKNFLRAKKIAWFEDETNEDEKFLRNKIRKFLDSFEEKNLLQKRIKNASEEIARVRDFFDKIVEIEASEIAEEQPDGSFLINHKKFQKLDEKIALRILVSVLMKVGGKTYKPRLAKLKNFYEYLCGDEIKPRSFYGCAAKKFDRSRIEIRSYSTAQ